MSQPYIFKKQVITIVVLILCLLFVNLFSIGLLYIKPIVFFMIVTASITFIPSLGRHVNYPVFIHCIVYYSPMIIPLFFVSIKLNDQKNGLGIMIGLVLGLLLLLSNYRHNKVYISSLNIQTLVPLPVLEFAYLIFENTYSVICEELFFRYFLIGYLNEEIGLISVVLSTILFVYAHFINRWANVVFNKRSYFYHFITGMSFGVLFFYTKSILGCIIAHLVFNSPEFFVLFKRLTHVDNSKHMFDDY